VKCLGLSTVALLALFTLTAVHPSCGTSFTPSPADLGDLDHHLVYTWRIDNIMLGPNSITGATLSFSNISNWDANPCFCHRSHPTIALRLWLSVSAVTIDKSYREFFNDAYFLWAFQGSN
jgi:hypothetical protein